MGLKRWEGWLSRDLARDGETDKKKRDGETYKKKRGEKVGLGLRRVT